MMHSKFSILILIVFSILLLCNCKSENKRNAIEFTINWNNTKCDINKTHWAINDYETATPSLIADTGLWQYTQLLQPEIVRIHHALIADSLTSTKTRTWDKDRIASCFNLAQKAFPNARFLVNPICEWPKWLGAKSRVLDAKQETEIIRLFVEFANIVKELKIPIEAIEVFNEREKGYDEAGKLPELWNFYNRISVAISNTNNNLLIAGPALTWPKKEWTESFLDSCGKNTNILTWHCYVSGKPETSNHQIVYSGVNKIDSLAQYTQVEIAKRGLKSMKNYLTEFNIQWVWEPYESRHGSNVGAVFQSLVVSKMSRQNIDATMVWHLKGHSYGLIESNNEVRSTGYLYLWGNKFLCGNMVESLTSDHRLEIMAVKRPDGERSVLLINKSDDELIFQASQSNLGFKADHVLQLNNHEYRPQKIETKDNELKLAAWSVTLINSDKNEN